MPFALKEGLSFLRHKHGDRHYAELDGNRDI